MQRCRATLGSTLPHWPHLERVNCFARADTPPPCVHPKPTTSGAPWNLLGLCSLHTSLAARAACHHAEGLPPTRHGPKQAPTSRCASPRLIRPELVPVDARAPARRAQPSARNCLCAAHHCHDTHCRELWLAMLLFRLYARAWAVKSPARDHGNGHSRRGSRPNSTKERERETVFIT